MPFPRDGEAARLYAHLNDPPPAPSLYAPEVSMALDDVVIRAMSKQPGDRYPSAGDLGRAAAAAVTGTAVVIPERTVATGAAATREPQTAASPEPAATPAPTREPTTATRPLDTERESGAERPAAAGGRRRLVLAGAALAAVALVAAAIAIAGSGGGGDGDDATATTAQRQAPPPQEERKPKPAPLSRSELINRADEVCVASQRRYVAIRDLEQEYSTEVPYAEALVRNARQRVRGLRRLTPPPSLAGPYREYVEAQERVYDTDVQALAAARKGDVAGVEAARDRRDSEDSLREDLAREIGFGVCSVPKN